MSATGSTNTFSYWYSPDIHISGESNLYKSVWTMSSTAFSPDASVQFRLRINQKGSWSAWNHIINSNNGQAPLAGENKVYNLYFDPIISGIGDDMFILNYDIMSFDFLDDTYSWICLEEIEIHEASITPLLTNVSYTFDYTSEGWTFLGKAPLFDEPISVVETGHLGLNPNSSANCFSYWFSPDIWIADAKVYRALYQVGSSVTNPDSSVQFRLRVNQKGSWKAWDRIVNSNLQQTPSVGNSKSYGVILESTITGVGNDYLAVSNFDILSFDAFDDTSSWIYLESLVFEEVTLTP